MRLANRLIILIGIGGILVAALNLGVFAYTIYSMNDVIGELDFETISNRTDEEISQDFAAELSFSLKKMINNEIDDQIVIVIFMSLVILSLFLAMLCYFVNSTLAPLEQVVECAGRFAKGDWSKSISCHGNDEAAALSRSLGHIRDRMESSISKLRGSHQREKNARREIESVNHLKSDFISEIAAELKNPLNSITGLAGAVNDDLERGATAEDIRDKVNGITASADLLDQLVSNLSELSKLDGCGESANEEEVDLPSLLSSLKFVYEWAQTRGVQLQFRYSNTMPQSIRTDPAVLAAAMRNLLSVAIQLSPRGAEIVISCYAMESDVVLRIRSGNTEADPVTPTLLLNNLIDFNFTNHPHFKGTHLLNLLVAKAKAGMIGAVITGEWDSEGYSLIKLTLERAAAAMPDEEDDIITHTTTNWINRRELGIRGPHTIKPILVAVDDEANKLMIEGTLNREEFAVDMVDDWTGCDRALRENKYQALIIDLRISGTAIVNVIKGIIERLRERSPAIFVILPYIEDGLEEALLAAGAAGVMLKPVDMQALISRLRDVV